MIRFLFSFVPIVVGITTAQSCSPPEGPEQPIVVINEQAEDSISGSTTPILTKDTTFNIPFKGNQIEVVIKFPKTHTFKGTIVALPGWNFPNTQWCDSTDLCSKALAKGYAVILPQMGKSIYCDTIFPETRMDWLKYPTRSWMRETMIPAIQKSCKLLLEDQNNHVMGLSTGARGAVLLALDLPKIFKACAALSGDFDQTRYTKDNLYNGYYGSYSKFTDRWTKNDNAITSIERLTVPIYLAHGKNDQIVPLAYSVQLFDALQDAGNEKSVLVVNPKAGHTYSFWNSEVNAVLEFFDKLNEK